jgi:hypothetical protein
MRIAFQIVILLLVGGLATSAWAQGGQRQGQPRKEKKEKEDEEPTGPTTVAIGERAPELAAAGWINYSGTPKLERFRGRVVVLFFFRTDDASAELIPAVSDAYKTFTRLGVVIIGLTPQKKEQVDSLVKAKELKFIVGYGVDTVTRYEVSSFPKVYLLDTAGLLVQRFHPGDDLEGRLRAQLRKTPPAGADAAGLERRLEQAKTALKEAEYGRAYTLALDVSKLAEKDSGPAKAAVELTKKIEDAARKWLEEAKAAVKAAAAPNAKDADSKYDRACELLAQLSVRFAGADLGRQADDEVARLMGDARLKPKLRSAINNAKAQLILDQAAQEEASSRYLEAFRLYRSVTEEFGETDAAKQADTALDRLRSDPKLQDSIKNIRMEEEAERWLDLGDRFTKLEMYGQAREYYERIVERHGDTRAAPKAKERLAKLPEEKPEEATPPAEEEGGEGSASEGD